MNRLSKEQRVAVQEAKKGKSILLTGVGGTGKTKVIQHIKATLESCNKKVAVTATTGTVAVDIKGTTLHAWMGIYNDKPPPQQILSEQVVPNKATVRRWQTTHSLIIDEVSMLGSKMCNLLNFIAQSVRKSKKPFGGLQLILCGDFLQLPPVKDSFCFQSPIWNRAITKVVTLTQVFRQDDVELVHLLNCVRKGQSLTTDQLSMLTQRDSEGDDDGLEYTRLYPRNADVDLRNAERLDQLPGPIHVYTSNDSCCKPNEKFTWCNLAKVLSLKEGAHVVLVKNLDVSRGLANGTTGVVVGFTTMKDPIVKFPTAGVTEVIPRIKACRWSVNNRVTASREQYPLRLAYALTIHKSQGMSLDRIVVDLNHAFAPGQTYVAMSRARTLEGLRVLNYSPEAIKVSQVALDFYEQHEQAPQPASKRQRAKQIQDQ